MPRRLNGRSQGNDLVRFAIVVENVGAGRNGAFNVTVKDAFPTSPVPNYTLVAGSLQVTDGAGNPQSSNAFRSLSSDHFNDWTVGLNLAVPLGYRYEHASVRSWFPKARLRRSSESFSGDFLVGDVTQMFAVPKRRLEASDHWLVDEGSMLPPVSVVDSAHVMQPSSADARW